MAITTAINTAASAKAEATGASPSSPVEASLNANDAKTAPTSKGASAPAPAGGPKRRRRINTPERRATHNAAERMRRESVNGRFLTLASLLPPLAALRRPSKAAIVSTSIAAVHAARRHRVLAAQTLRALTKETETLRREINDWRARALLPQLATPERSEAHAAVLRAEVEDFDLTLEGFDLEENDNENDGEDDLNNQNENEEGGESPVAASPVPPQQPRVEETQAKRARSASTVSPPGSAHGPAFYSPAPGHPHKSQHFAFDEPSPVSPSGASSASGGWDGPLTPPASAGVMLGSQMLPAPMMGGGMNGFDLQGYYEPPHIAGVAYGEESFLMGNSTSMGMGVGEGMIGGGMGWAGGNPSHPAFHQQQVAAHAVHLREAYAQQQQMVGALMKQQMGMQMQINAGMGAMGAMDMSGVAQGQYLHQPTRFA